MKKKYCILLVDDEVDICEKLAEAFELEDFIALTATSANHAIQVIKENPNIDIIISDVRMPDGDGLALLEYVKANLSSKLPLIMQSGFSEISKEEFIGLGAAAYLKKPTNIDDLIEFVKSMLDS
jgi:DNA-binding NtrC family response regulator